MPDINDPPDEHEALSEFWEKIDLLVYLAIIAVVTPPVARMVSAGWDSHGIVWGGVYALEETLGVTHHGFKLFCLGAFGALVLLLLLDEMKRIQGFLLATASGVALVVFRSIGAIFPLFPLQDFPALVSGFAIAFFLGGGVKLRTSEPPYEFRRATSLLFWLVSFIVGLGFVEKHLRYENPLFFSSERTAKAVTTSAEFALAGNQFFTDIVASSVFVVGAFMFTSYRAKTDVFVLGVQRAGKTLLGAALHIAADENAKNTRRNPSVPLSRLVSSLRTAEEGWGDEEYTGPTQKGEYHLLQFQTRAGTLFKEYVEIDVLDYAGEYLDGELVDLVEGLVPKSRLSLSWIVYKYESLRGCPVLPEKATNLGSKAIRRIMAKQIIHSDTLVVIIDSGSLISDIPYGEDDYEAQQDLSEYLDNYVQILRHLNESLLAEKDVVLVATKADYLYQLYRNSGSHLSFFNWVDFHLLESEKGREKIEPLLNQAQVECVYPIYYDLDHEQSLEKNEPVPEHPLSIHGNEKILTRLKEGT